MLKEFSDALKESQDKLPLICDTQSDVESPKVTPVITISTDIFPKDSILIPPEVTTVIAKFVDVLSKDVTQLH